EAVRSQGGVVIGGAAVELHHRCRRAERIAGCGANGAPDVMPALAAGAIAGEVELEAVAGQEGRILAGAAVERRQRSGASEGDPRIAGWGRRQLIRTSAVGGVVAPHVPSGIPVGAAVGEGPSTDAEPFRTDGWTAIAIQAGPGLIGLGIEELAGGTLNRADV